MIRYDLYVQNLCIERVGLHALGKSLEGRLEISQNSVNLDRQQWFYYKIQA